MEYAARRAKKKTSRPWRWTRGGRFETSTEDNVPNASIVHDRFHISKYLGEAVDKVRRAEHKQQLNAIVKSTVKTGRACRIRELSATFGMRRAATGIVSRSAPFELFTAAGRCFSSSSDSQLSLTLCSCIEEQWRSSAASFIRKTPTLYRTL